MPFEVCKEDLKRNLSRRILLRRKWNLRMTIFYICIWSQIVINVSNEDEIWIELYGNGCKNSNNSGKAFKIGRLIWRFIKICWIAETHRKSVYYATQSRYEVLKTGWGQNFTLLNAHMITGFCEKHRKMCMQTIRW